jgi:hypothetical protein
MRHFIFLILFFYSINISFAQEIMSLVKTSVEQKNFVDTIQFEFIKNKIIIPVTIGNEEKKYFFDTGAPLTISKNLQTSMNYHLLTKRIMVDANGTRDSVEIVEVKEFEWGKIKFRNSASVVANLDTVLFQCFGVEGCIGPNILNGMIIKIDVKNKHLIVTDKKTFFKSDKGYTVALKNKDKQNSPVLSISPFKKTKEEIFFDTGDDSFYNLSNRNFLFFNERVDLTKNILHKGVGSRAVGMFGNEKDSLNHLLKSNDFKIGKLSFSNVYIGETFNSNSRLGADILNYGVVILDFIRQKFTFIPYDKVDSAISLPTPFHDFYLILENGKLKIGLIWENSESYKIGLRKGFIIKQINHLDLENFCETAILNLKDEFMKPEIELKVIDLESNEKEFTIKNKEVYHDN